MQLAMESILTEGITHRVDIWAGYSWGMQTDGLDDWITGVVVSPKHFERAARERRLSALERDRYSGRPLEAEVWEDAELEAVDSPLGMMLDNGAFPAWRDGVELGLGEQLDSLHRGLELFPMADWIVAPDIVARPRASWARTVASLTELEAYGLHRVLVPFQNGMDVERVAGLAQSLQSGVFVGGTEEWKLEAVRQLEGRGLYVHVGRVSGDAELAACARHGVASVDSSSFLRRQRNNLAKRTTYRQSFERYARRRAGALDDQRPRNNWSSSNSHRLGYWS